MNVSINNPNQYRHGIMVNLEAAVADGHFDQSAVNARVQRAMTVLRTYEVAELGTYVNGWNENVTGYRLTSPAGRTYEVQIRANGQGSCNCPDWIYRRRSNAGLCKHVLAVQGLHQVISQRG